MISNEAMKGIKYREKCKKIMADMKFREKCIEFGIAWCNSFVVYNDIIIVETSHDNVFVLFDDKYNTVGFLKLGSDYDISPEEYIDVYKDVHENANNEAGCTLSYPFNKLSIRQIEEISDYIIDNDINHADKFHIEVNGKELDIYDTRICLLDYFMFISEQIKDYWHIAYQSEMMGIKFPDVYTYINIIIKNINECVRKNCEKGKRTFPTEVIEYLGQHSSENVDIYQRKLYGIIELLINEMGYKIDEPENEKAIPDRVIPVVTDGIDLSKEMLEALKLVSLSGKEMSTEQGINIICPNNDELPGISIDGSKEVNMYDQYRAMTIGDVIQYLPLDKMVDVLKYKGLTNEEIMILLKNEKSRYTNEAEKQEWFRAVDEMFTEESGKGSK